MRVQEVCLSWDEAQEHYHAIHQIEERYSLEHHRGKISNGLKKKTDAKIHNETNTYLRSKELIYRNGVFFKTILASND